MKKKSISDFAKMKDYVDYDIKRRGSNYSALVVFLDGSKKTMVSFGNLEEFCIKDVGYKWLTYLPLNEFWCLHTFYDDKGEVVEWYIDINNRNYIDDNGLPCFDDLYLDIVVLPNGRKEMLDADELQYALDTGEITMKEFNHDYKVYDKLMNSEWTDVGHLLEFTGKLLAEF